MKSAISISAVLLLLSDALSAQSFYVGATVGQSIGDSSPPLAVEEFQLDASKRLLAGWKFTDAFALEASYHDFGTASGKYHPCAPPCPTDIPVSLKTISEAWSLRLEYSLGDRQWQPFAALGWTWRDAEVRSRGLGSGVWVGNDESDNRLSAELGARLHLPHGFALRAGYEWFDLPRSGGALNAGAEYAF